MKRDLELVKKILEYYEAKDTWRHDKELQIEGYSLDETQYNLQIMYEGGFINAEPISTENGRLHGLLPFRLTWEGHEFLDSIRDKKVWSKIKSLAVAKGGQLSFELVKQFAAKLSEAELLKHLLP